MLKLSLPVLVSLAITFFTSNALASGDVFVLQVRTSALPGVHFDSIRTELWNPDGVLIGSVDHAAEPLRDYALGVRTAEFHPGSGQGTYTGRTSLRLGGGVVVERPWRLIDRGRHRIYVLTVLLVTDFTPITNVPKVVAFDDRDSSSTVSPGDELFFTISFVTVHALGRGSVLRDVPPLGAPLIPGSVTTSHGVVFRGNLPSDTDVEVRFGNVPVDESVIVDFRTRVTCLNRYIINQGMLTARVAGSRIEYEQLTDNPYTPFTDDATVVPVDCSGQEPPTKLDELKVFPSVLPQYVSGPVRIEGSMNLGGPNSGAPLLTINGFSVKTEFSAANEQKETAVFATLVPGMTEMAGVVPFTLTPEDLQLPPVKGWVEIRQALETSEAIGAAYQQTVTELIGQHLQEGVRLFEQARTHAHLDPASCESLKVELKSDLQHVNELGALQIQASANAAKQQAVARDAQNLDVITKAASDGLILLSDAIQELANKAGKESKNGQGKGMPVELICPE